MVFTVLGATVLAAAVLAAAAAVLLAPTRSSSPAPSVPPGAADIPVPIEGGGADGMARERGSPAPRTADEQEAPAAAEWLESTARSTGIAERALFGYASAQLAMEREQPDCRVSWPTLAGIGSVESRHGTLDGSEIGADGRTTEDIIGIALDGSGVEAVPDTDGGAYDGDTEWDRAVGPMQFIPETWERWGDGDPHNIDDAALAAARYLCADSRNLSDAGDWNDAVLSYNRSQDYAADVLRNADTYATASRTAATG
ncbi:lytic murein transglycosylase [Nocardiopsis coralliicola]